MTVTATDPTVVTEDIEGGPPSPPPDPTAGPDRLVEEDLLVEDVSIDGMCGVY
jgi:mycofactocin precursor